MALFDEFSRRTVGLRTVLPTVMLAIVTPACSAAQSVPDLITSLERLASTGNAEAIYHLGMAYQTGSGIAEDHTKALGAFRKAAALGDPLGAYKLGCYYAGQDESVIAPDDTQALKYKLIAAEAGYALAQQDVGMMYGRSGNAAKGLGWLEKSANQGWSGGLMALASIYNGAPGIDRDAAKTAAYFRLFLIRSEADEEQRTWLTSFETHLSAAERKRSTEIVRTYRPMPTAITIKALSGQRAAQALVDRTP